MVELESEGEMTRTQVASFLRRLADELGDGTAGGELTEAELEEGERTTHEHKEITFVINGESATVTMPNVVNFDVEVESRSPMFRSGINQEIEMELSWGIEKPDQEEEGEWIKIR